MEYLLSHGADVNALDVWGHTPLLEAVRGRHVLVSRLLRGAGGEMSSADSHQDLGHEMMLYAALQGDVQQLKLMDECGVDVNQVSGREGGGRRRKGGEGGQGNEAGG